jgi:pimeloyl-ACP methyl ester carboxylesterase
MRLLWLAWCVLGLGWVGWPAGSAAGAEVEAGSSLPVLLVHGIAWELDEEDSSWGRLGYDADGSPTWSGMIGFLDSKGLRVGGIIRPIKGKVELPEHLDTAGVRGAPRKARLFLLKFSSAANTDGIAYKALELAEAVRQLSLLTGAEKVRIVAHSAGGLFARAYLQNALPGVPFRGDVDRLITIATPHLGSHLAHHLGDFLGTRATSIEPDAAMMRNLNSTLDLPEGVTFASIVVRGLGADVRGKGKQYDRLVDHRLLDRLPLGYREGGDQVVHVQSQNLRLAECAERYERRTGRPVQYVLARVADPKPTRFRLRELTDVRVHATAPFDETVQHLVFGLLSDGALLWQKADPEKLADWCLWQARLHASGLIESQALAMHPMSQATSIRIDEFEPLDAEGQSRAYRFAGKAWSKNVAVPFRKRWTHVRGTLKLEFDEFGRVVAAESRIEERKDE